MRCCRSRLPRGGALSLRQEGGLRQSEPVASEHVLVLRESVRVRPTRASRLRDVFASPCDENSTMRGTPPRAHAPSSGQKAYRCISSACRFVIDAEAFHKHTRMLTPRLSAAPLALASSTSDLESASCDLLLANTCMHLVVMRMRRIQIHLTMDTERPRDRHRRTTCRACARRVAHIYGAHLCTLRY